jgi:NAD(P)-dependent dehydrogenase (short-subunit alcohol dehydrogenase family)
MLRNQVAIVTGSGRGIGRAIALAMAAEGASVVVNSITGSNCRKVADEIQRMKAKSLAALGDVSRVVDVESIVQKTMRRFGTIDILVNNVGMTSLKPILELEEHEWDRIIEVNLKSAFLCSKEVAKVMKEKRNGVIINIASIAGIAGRPNRSAYCASKAGMILLTQCMACEWTKYGIRVNAIAPGITRTDRTMAKTSKERTELERRTLIGRMATSDEIAKVAVFLASDSASYIVGSTITVDGGWTSYSFT